MAIDVQVSNNTSLAQAAAIISTNALTPLLLATASFLNVK